MNIEYLHYFLDVAKTKSITRAAKLNFISPQGMSRAMNKFNAWAPPEKSETNQ